MIAAKEYKRRDEQRDIFYSFFKERMEGLSTTYHNLKDDNLQNMFTYFSAEEKNIDITGYNLSFSVGQMNFYITANMNSVDPVSCIVFVTSEIIPQEGKPWCERKIIDSLHMFVDHVNGKYIAYIKGGETKAVEYAKQAGQIEKDYCELLMKYIEEVESKKLKSIK